MEPSVYHRPAVAAARGRDATHARVVAPAAVAAHYTDEYLRDCQSLGCVPPDVQPRATGHIAEMQTQIQQLIERGLAYAVDGDESDEAQALIDDTIAWCTTADRVYTHEWRLGDVLVWDERAILHRGRPWPYDEERTLASVCASATEADGLASIRPPG